MLLLAERRLGLDVRAGTGGGGSSLNRLSRYAGRVPDVDGRGSTIAIVCWRYAERRSVVQNNVVTRDEICPDVGKDEAVVAISI